jgi:signal transduction histidine kinase
MTFSPPTDDISVAPAESFGRGAADPRWDAVESASTLFGGVTAFVALLPAGVVELAAVAGSDPARAKELAPLVSVVREVDEPWVLVGVESGSDNPDHLLAVSLRHGDGEIFGALAVAIHDAAAASDPRIETLLRIAGGLSSEHGTGASTGTEAGTALADTDSRILAEKYRKAREEAEWNAARLQETLDAALVLAEEAQASSRAKSEFLAVVSHELRTPLTGILGMSEILSATSSDPTVRECADAIRVCGDRLLSSVNDILDFTRLESGELSLGAALFDPAAAVADAVAEAEPLFRGRGLHLEFRQGPGLPDRIQTDPRRFRQVVGILLSNAAKFTEHGGAVITVESEEIPSLHDLSRMEPQVRIGVADTGIGIPPERQSALFHRFRQVDSGQTRRAGGLGLGLALARGLVGLMDGRIGFESEVGRGSRFWFAVSLHPPSDPSPLPVIPS